MGGSLVEMNCLHRTRFQHQGEFLSTSKLPQALARRLRSPVRQSYRLYRVLEVEFSGGEELQPLPKGESWTKLRTSHSSTQVVAMLAEVCYI